ncbi:hypothetical protein KZ843_06960 [Pseudomonas aeruginosa]|nr:hypothetical protein [Pseudomonas aeruginosa]MBW6122633.1 hypothetical protein [Pseudomonas aeruginosa]
MSKKKNKPKAGAKAAPPVAPATNSRPILAATLGAIGDLAGNFSVGFFFLICSLLVGKDSLTAAQFGYVVWAAMCCLVLAVVMMGLRVYSATIK